jgi:predicted CopG family antitoxin
MEQTTIQISKGLIEELKKRKMAEKESYEQVIWDLIEDTMELSEETKKAIALGREQFQEGKFISFEDLKREFS